MAKKEIQNELENTGVQNIKEEKTQKDNFKRKNVFNTVLSVVIAVLLFCLSFAGGYFTNYLTHGRNANVAWDIVSIMEKVGYIYDPATGKTREITEKEVADALVNAFLDEYSAYYTQEEYKTVQSNANGNYGGVGVSFFDDADLAVDQVVMNSPLDRAGLKVGDEIVSAARQGQGETEFTSVNQILQFIGELDLNERVTFKYSRAGTEYQATVKKENYVRAYVYYCDDNKEYRFISENGDAPVGEESALYDSKITDSSVGYIRLDGFAGDAAKQIEQALNYMESRQKTKLVLDLRDNGGGYMNVLTHVASYFIHNGGAKKTPVAYAQGKTGTEEYSTDKNRFCEFLENMVIIANENTASASECLIGAIVTYGDLISGVDGVIVERNATGTVRTYGKGIMQTTYQLVTGGAFKLTTARILWPDESTCIHGVGVTPEMGCTVSERGFGIEKAQEKLAG